MGGGNGKILYTRKPNIIFVHLQVKSLLLFDMFSCQFKGLLGITIRHDSFQESDNYIRVLEVSEGSPAEEANLVPHTDFILGTAGLSSPCFLYSFVYLDCDYILLIHRAIKFMF